MLGQTYRFLVLNNSGVQLDFSGNSTNEKADVTFEPWKISSGALAYASEVSHAASTDLADGSAEALTTVDNSSALNMGLNGTFRVETDNASADGDVHLLLEYSTDGGTTWPSAATNFDPDTDAIHLATVTLSGAEVVSTNFAVS